MKRGAIERPKIRVERLDWQLNYIKEVGAGNSERKEAGKERQDVGG